MNILHINVSYIMSALHQTMIDHLNEHDQHNKVFVPTYDKKRSIIKEKEYATILECFKKWDRLFYFKKQRKIIDAAIDTYDIGSFDLIHAYTLFTDGNTAMELSKKYGVPYVVAVRNTDVNDFFKKMVHLRAHGVKILKNAKAVFFLSPAYRDYVIEKFIPDSEKQDIINKSYVIPNGIDDFWLQNSLERDFNTFNQNISQRKLNILYVGGIDANKNVETSLKALELLQKEGWNVSFKAIGKVVEQSIYSRLLQYPFFHYEPSKEKEQLIHSYRGADIFIMPSIHETFGLVYAEAMSQGLPVIYTKGQGFDRQFEDGCVGYAVNPRSPDDIVEKIKFIVKDYEGISSRATDSSTIFDWHKITKRYCDIYQQSCKK